VSLALEALPTPVDCLRDLLVERGRIKVWINRLGMEINRTWGGDQLREG